MVVITGRRRDRYELVGAAHEFVLTALPFRHRDSRAALEIFCDAVRHSPLSTPDLEAVLLSLLGVLEPHTSGRLPSLVDRYLAERRNSGDPVGQFYTCVDDAIRYRGVGHPQLQDAIRLLEERYHDPRLSQTDVASDVNLTSQELSALFGAQLHVTFTEYLRTFRLDKAAATLVLTRESIKAIWVAAGFNDASNFCHYFKERFGVSPGRYRARAINEVRKCSLTQPAPRPSGGPRASLLIVDDNASTRETLGRYLESIGYRVALADSGRSAVDTASRSVFDAIVLDYHLPDASGIECVAWLRQEAERPWPGVLLFTADWEVEDEARAAASLGAMYASKLCDLAELERLVATLVSMRDVLV